MYIVLILLCSYLAIVCNQNHYIPTYSTAFY
nr:MAG TPA: hypothetical protein [Bacteriophage sp.]